MKIRKVFKLHARLSKMPKFKKHTIIVEKTILSLNKINSWRYAKQFYRIREEKEAWGAVILAQLSGYMKATGKRKITITSYRKRRIDQDNLKGGAKQLLDALKALQLIKDDSLKWVSVKYNPQVLDGKNPRTKIEIEEM